MTQWTYVILAYAVGIGGTLALLLFSRSALRRAEKQFDEIKRK
ncbi:MAG: hypothetical protein R3E02_03765 [Blastomonas sp.]